MVAACTALGEIGRNGPLPIPSEGTGFTKLQLVESLLARIPSSKETNKARLCSAATILVNFWNALSPGLCITYQTQPRFLKELGLLLALVSQN